MKWWLVSPLRINTHSTPAGGSGPNLAKDWILIAYRQASERGRSSAVKNLNRHIRKFTPGWVEHGDQIA
ncbi:hypothetical protein CQ017_11845 [Arthrobacter sp. MYb224]|nr:hypothetical protein CQ017_11845 [Arthrobacter sp. MYb224]PQZ98530.1 hypothetical protein CQ019_16990 [Arthrobacter sp. MYb229]PRB47228.1 hypothetical protein CQ013_17230 [Arthrobacter sp. MYb216]